ncbi:MAG TPA: EutN/CcmL family microcompartment protein [Thermoanaerobaculia bacterium]|jgi:microcompartment protein CcmK/EutM|nr:EutN/CcmL family microcompartment protein [Thermoanaerobaculia bacterium]
MILGRIVGEIHGTIKHRFYEGKRLLIIEKMSHNGAPTGDYLIAADSVGAGADETVLVLDEGNGARQVFDSKDGPVRSVVIGIIDDIV